MRRHSASAGSTTLSGWSPSRASVPVTASRSVRSTADQNPASAGSSPAAPSGAAVHIRDSGQYRLRWNA
ncbi:hypothetical protein H0E86_00765 [Streptomyces sp. SCSIO-PteL053]|nr:hypothetical protein H0E86_00765 [Streptomyces sp. SCSIO-PteL053]